MDAAVTPHVPSPSLHPYPLHHYRLALIKQYYLISSGIMSGLDLCRINMDPRHGSNLIIHSPSACASFHGTIWVFTHQLIIAAFINFSHTLTLCVALWSLHITLGPLGLRRANFHRWFKCTASNLHFQLQLSWYETVTLDRRCERIQPDFSPKSVSTD